MAKSPDIGSHIVITQKNNYIYHEIFCNSSKHVFLGL